MTAILTSTEAQLSDPSPILTCRQTAAMSPHLRSRSSGSDRSCPKAPTSAPGASALEEQQRSPPGLPWDDWPLFLPVLLHALCGETSGPDSRNNSLFLLLPLPHLLCLTVCVLVWRLVVNGESLPITFHPLICKRGSH